MPARQHDTWWKTSCWCVRTSILSLRQASGDKATRASQRHCDVVLLFGIPHFSTARITQSLRGSVQG
jgi:hypothetical protein